MLYYSLYDKNHANTSERRKAFLPYQCIMENNQNPTPNRPQRKQLAPRDMLIVALVILAITRLDFSNFTSFHVLLLFLVFLLLMLRWGNMRKSAVRKQAMERYKDQFEAESENKSAFRWADAPADSPAEKVSVADMAIDNDAVPTEEIHTVEETETAPIEEKPAE